jgi:hypothetical protein
MVFTRLGLPLWVPLFAKRESLQHSYTLGDK